MHPAGCHAVRPNTLLVPGRPRQLLLGDRAALAPHASSGKPRQTMGTFCSFSYCFQGQILSAICRWKRTWTRSLLQQQWAPHRAPQGGGTAPVWSCSSPTGCLWEQVLPVGLAVLQPAVVKPCPRHPSSRPGMQHLAATHSRLCDWCHGNEVHLALWECSRYSFPPAPTS